MIRFRLILVAVIALSALIALPGLPATHKKVPLTVKLVFSTGYDDNILKYSAQDINYFRDNLEPYTPPITTTDDWINSAGLRLYRDFNLGRRFHFRPYYAGRLAVYAVNPIKNTQWHDLEARFSYRSLAYVTLKYYYMPNYFLRVYYDRDTKAYHGTDFNLTRPSISLRVNYNPYEMEIEGGREFDYYNGYFTEFDVRADFIGLTGTYHGIPYLDASLGYMFKKGNNIGFDQHVVGSLLDPALESDYGDGSYQEDAYKIELGYQLPRLRKTIYWKASLSCERAYRYYQSNQPLLLDPVHAGRRDRRDIIEPGLTVAPTSDLELQLGFIYDLRRTRSPDPRIPAIKNYDDRAIEFTIVYQVF